MPSPTFSIKKGSIALYLGLIAVSIVAMVALKRYAGGATAASNAGASADTINIAIEYSPLSLYTYDDTLGGFSYDLMRLVERHSGGHRFSFHPIVNLENSLQGLEKGTYHMVIAQFPTTKGNRDLYLFSEALYLDRQVLIQRRDSAGAVAIKSQLDLAGKVINVVKGSPMQSRLANMSHEIGDTIYIAEDPDYGPEQLFLRVATGEIDYAVINESIAAQMSQRYPQVSYDTEVSFTQFQPVIMRKSDQALCDSLNSWLAATKLTGQFKQLQKRYFE